jgi:hypothetical protein
MAVVGHGGYLRTDVWRQLTGRPKPRMSNLDAFIIEGDLDTATGRLLHRRVVELPYTERIAGPDRCVVTEDNQHVLRHTRKISASRRMGHTRKHKHTSRCGHMRRQHGGATPMPLAYYQPGAYETRGLEATGAGIAGSSAGWIREAVTQTGGRRTRRSRRIKGNRSAHQSGGFSPSVMGQFASAGLRMLPVAGYMGYKMFNKTQKKRARRR